MYRGGGRGGGTEGREERECGSEGDCSCAALTSLSTDVGLVNLEDEIGLPVGSSPRELSLPFVLPFKTVLLRDGKGGGCAEIVLSESDTLSPKGFCGLRDVEDVLDIDDELEEAE